MILVTSLMLTSTLAKNFTYFLYISEYYIFIYSNKIMYFCISLT